MQNFSPIDLKKWIKSKSSMQNFSQIDLHKWTRYSWRWYNGWWISTNDGNNFVPHNFETGMEPDNYVVGKNSSRTLEKIARV